MSTMLRRAAAVLLVPVVAPSTGGDHPTADRVREAPAARAAQPAPAMPAGPAVANARMQQVLDQFAALAVRALT